jgi:hypothetical protein
VSSYGCLSYIYSRSVVYSVATSDYNYNIAATNLVWCAVCGGSSIRSRQLALYLALSILLFCAAKISSRSTGVGIASDSGLVEPSPRNLRILDIWGSFFALAAEPRIKTNFYSSSVASYYSLVSRVYRSTLLECVPLCLALSNCVNRAS